jgi:hypothetical protein
MQKADHCHTQKVWCKGGLTMSEQPLQELVTPQWVKAQIRRLDLRVNDIVEHTGVNQSNVSAWINGLRPMSASVKAMFYWYFTCADVVQLMNDLKNESNS